MIRLENKTDCCGCNACVQSCPKDCITMQEDNEGFLYPSINIETCIDCSLCEKVCPEIHQGKGRKPLQVFAAKNKNEKIRVQSSSGGIFTLLAEKTIEENGVVFGARFDENWEVIHDYTETIEGLSAFRGSKYVQSRIGETFSQTKQFLKAGLKVLFSGTPCQIAGLKLFLQKDYENLLTVDFVCHGVPSPKVWRKYLNELSNETVSGISFRDKTKGWKVFSFSLSKNNQKQGLFIETLHQNVFMKGFLKDLYLRPSCYDCPSKSFKSGSDITLGDYWGIQDILPEFDDDKGVSLVMINSVKGQEVYNQLNTESIGTTYENALAGNPSIETSVRKTGKRDVFMKNMEAKDGSIIDLINKITKLSFREWMRIRVIKILVHLKLFTIIQRICGKK
jgi:coenzyme F420-reducing hydrogenase beta subunit